MSNIGVAGAGHGGLVAAARLAEAGHRVTVYEKCREGEYCLDQKDSLDATAMEYAGIEIPEHFNAPPNRLTFVPLDSDVEPVTLPASEGYRNLTVDRKEFHGYLTKFAADAGVNFVYDCEIYSPIMLGSRVGGLKTSEGDFYHDLIIDACGVHSPVRNGLPDFTCIEKDPVPYDILHSYRAYFDKVPGVPDPKNDYNLYIKEDGTTGFKWCKTENDCVDVLVVRFPETDYTDIAYALLSVSEDNPQMGKNILRGGKFVDIPVRQPLAILVADGYAAVGDSAYMTSPLKGSGLALSIRAGRILAEEVLEDEAGLFDTETLWEYEKRFFKEIGYDACRLAVLKNLLPYLTAEDVNNLFKTKLITEEDVENFFSGNISKLKLPSLLKEKISILNDMPELRAKLFDVVSWMGKLTVMEPFFPEKYSKDDVKKWSERYNKLFDSIRRNDNN